MGNEKNGSTMDPKPADRILLIFAVLLSLGIAYKLSYPVIVSTIWFVRLHPSGISFLLKSMLFFGFIITLGTLWNKFITWREVKHITLSDDGSVYLGKDTETKEEVHLKADFRTMHTQLIGTTNAGKTASVIMPWIAQDIEKGRGMLIVDGKSDRSFLDKLYAYAAQHGRKNDVMVFSLTNPNISSTFNPLAQGTPEQITERIFSTFEFTEEYYKNAQYEALRTVLTLLVKRGQIPTPGVVRELLRDKKKLLGWTEGLTDTNLLRDVLKMTELKDEEFDKKFSGLVTALGHFSQGETAALFNAKYPDIVLSEVLKSRKICYFQLPTMQLGILGSTTGKLLLQSLTSAISELQGAGTGKLKELFPIFLDDFNDYIYPGFVSLLNKSRSANIGVVFSHQSLGDLEKVGPDFRQGVMTNTNVKIIMRSNDPDSAETFASSIGTKDTEKTTERRKKGMFRDENTGEQSVRNVEEFRIHPNIFKGKLGRGEGIVVLPHQSGTMVKRVKFETVPDLPVIQMPIRDLPLMDFGEQATYYGAKRDELKAPPRGKNKKPSRPKGKNESENEKGT